MVPEKYETPLAWGLLVLVVLVVVAVTIVPLVGAHQQLSERIDRGYETLARLRAIADSGEDTRARATSLIQQDVSQFVFTGFRDADDLLLSLRKLIDDNAAAAGVELTSVDNLPPAPAQGIVRVGLMVRAQGEPAAIMELLRALEEHTPLLVTDDLDMRPSRSRRRRNAPQEQQVALNLRVYAWHLEPSA
jgi:hypothetical protein